jgi:hypothetical protein
MRRRSGKNSDTFEHVSRYFRYIPDEAALCHSKSSPKGRLESKIVSRALGRMCVLVMIVRILGSLAWTTSRRGSKRCPKPRMQRGACTSVLLAVPSAAVCLPTTVNRLLPMIGPPCHCNCPLQVHALRTWPMSSTQAMYVISWGFGVKMATALEAERKLVKRKLLYPSLCIKKHQGEVYNVIM